MTVKELIAESNAQEFQIGQVYLPLGPRVLSRRIVDISCGSVRYDTFNGLRYNRRTISVLGMFEWIRKRRAVLVKGPSNA